MITSVYKTISIILVVVLAGIWLGHVWDSFTLAQAQDYSLKCIITAAVLVIISYLISLLSPKKAK